MIFLRNRKKAVYIFIAVILGILIASAVYLSSFYHADMDAVAAFVADDSHEMKTEADGNIIWDVEQASEGFIFYPGGKVEHSAYIPLMEELAEKGIFCVLVEMPFHLAVFDVDAAAGIQEKYPEIENWYIGGHSLGGAMAASYLSENADLFEGLVLLGSYSASDLSQTDLRVLSVYGSEDLVMDREKYEQNKKNLPSDFTEIVIDGGCHGYFGMYGAQKGDGIPEITNEEQILFAADEIAAMIKVTKNHAEDQFLKLS